MCLHLDLGNGNHAIVCGVRETRRKCRDCGAHCTRLCDFPLGNGKTCDRPMCDSHRVVVGDDVDYCLPHSRVGKSFAVIAGAHIGHWMKILGFDRKAVMYSAMCSCGRHGNLGEAHLRQLDLEHVMPAESELRSAVEAAANAPAAAQTSLFG